MRILMTTDTVGGVWTYTRELAGGLLDAGCDVTLISMGRRPSSEQQAWALDTLSQFTGAFRYIPTEFTLEWMQNGAGCYADSREFLLGCIAAYSPDIVHCNQFCYGALPVEIPKLVVAHSDVLSWWQACRGTEPDESQWLSDYRQIVSEGLRGADCIIAPTKWMREQVLRHYGVHAPSLVIPNGRTIEPHPETTKTLRAVTAGRLWDEAKNVRILDAVDCEIPICVVGEAGFDGADVSSLTNDSVKLLSPMNERDLLDLLRESAIYIVTSRYEPFGLAPVEAALCGCAIVANDIPSLREVWADAAIYFAQNDPGSLSSALNKLASNPRQLQEFANTALARARQEYSSSRMVEQYLATYQQAVAQARVQYVA